ncbi:MAG: hypothetical protein SP1CHLAM54_12770 [Chlamydiia bacterium]|nr:hypothetical protein [Chlamydiia bacterium]MCH9616174.1 hypothetical protein [Chlamydiia bacterium]MCH9629840.1 hypothetical protein [Chlamydiia bacterium]
MHKWLFLLGVVQVLHANVIDDRDRIKQIKDRDSCIAILSQILEERRLDVPQDKLPSFELACDRFNATVKFVHLNNPSFFIGLWKMFEPFVIAYNKPLNIHSRLEYRKNQYVQGVLDKDLNDQLVEALSVAKTIPFIEEDYDKIFHHSSGLKSGGKLNTINRYFMLEDTQKKVIAKVLKALELPIMEYLGNPWRVLTVRAWETPPGNLEWGPNAWHTDGLPRSALKLMIYPLGASEAVGTTEIKTKEDDIIGIEGDPGTWLMFNNNELIHRGVAPLSKTRQIVEITYSPSIMNDMTVRVAGQNACYPLLPWELTTEEKNTLGKPPESGLILGGSHTSKHPEWLFLKSGFYPNMRFPLEENVINTVYVPHLLNQCNLPTVYRLLSEMHRTLKPGGDVVIKIPDFGQILSHLRGGDEAYFDVFWDLGERILPWHGRNVCKCIAHKAASLFCSFIGDEGGYKGIDDFDLPFLQEVLVLNSPFEIAKQLREAVYDKPGCCFVSESAWSEQEFVDLMRSFDFEVVSTERKEIADQFVDIPGINDLHSQSLYIWAKKK